MTRASLQDSPPLFFRHNTVYVRQRCAGGRSGAIQATRQDRRGVSRPSYRVNFKHPRCALCYVKGLYPLCQELAKLPNYFLDGSRAIARQLNLKSGPKMVFLGGLTKGTCKSCVSIL